MFILSDKRRGRVRVQCVENVPRDLVVIPFELDKGRPWMDADAIYEAMQFTWQMVPSCVADSSLFGLHIEVALPLPLLEKTLALEHDPTHQAARAPEPDWEPVLSKAPLASIQLVHYVLGYTRKLAERHTQQAPMHPLPAQTLSGVQRVRDTLSAMLDKVPA